MDLGTNNSIDCIIIYLRTQHTKRDDLSKLFQKITI